MSEPCIHGHVTDDAGQLPCVHCLRAKLTSRDIQLAAAEQRLKSLLCTTHLASGDRGEACVLCLLNEYAPGKAADDA